MAKDYPRTQRVAEQLKRELAQLVQSEVKDPRVGFLTVTHVEVSRDLQHATVYVTRLDAQADEREAALAGLRRAGGFLRHALGQRLVMRSVPQLRFRYDESVERGEHLMNLIERAVQDDDTRRPNEK